MFAMYVYQINFNINFRPPCQYGNVWRGLETRKRFFESVFQHWSNARDCSALFLGQEQERCWGLVSRRDATPCVTGCLAPHCQPKMEKCGKTCATPPRFSRTLSRMGCWCSVLTPAFSRLFTRTFFAQISTRQSDVTVLLAPPGNARDPNRKCNYKTDVYVTYRGILLSDYFIQLAF